MADTPQAPCRPSRLCLSATVRSATQLTTPPAASTKRLRNKSCVARFTDLGRLLMNEGALTQAVGQFSGRLDYLKIGEKVPFSENWSRLLNEWCATMNDYSTQSKNMNGWVRGRGGDLPYWYAKEEANVGFLAAAVWRLGGVTLQEFEVTRPDAKGQGDLWFKLGELECHIETKGTDSPKTAREAVDAALSEARIQLVLPDDEKAKTGLVACFAVPAVTGSSFDFRSLVKHFESDDSIVAVYLPCRDINTRYENDGYSYPGIAFIGQLVWNSGDSH